MLPPPPSLSADRDFERVKQHTFQKIKQSLELIPLRDQYKLEKDRNTVKRLSLANYRAPVPDVKLSDELPSSLRVLAPEGHLLADRMDSLFRREMLEPRVQKTYVVPPYFGGGESGRRGRRREAGSCWEWRGSMRVGVMHLAIPLCSSLALSLSASPPLPASRPLPLLRIPASC